MNLPNRSILIFTASLLASIAGYATPLTIGEIVAVKEVSVSPGRVVSIHASTLGDQSVWAGITNLLVDGLPVNSLCIDPFQWSSNSPLNYVVTDLAAAPIGVYAMGGDSANKIKNLWAMNFASALSDLTGKTAAGLQIAIWETLGGTNFSVVGDDYNAGTMISNLSDYQGLGADLVGLSNELNQDYVVQNVPDGGVTIALLGVGLLALAAFRKLRATGIHG